MSSFKQRSDYFKMIAHKNKLIAHNRPVEVGKEPLRKSFHRINNQDEFDAAVKSWGHYPCVVHLGHDLVFKQNNGTSLPRRVTHTVLRFLARTDRTTYKYEADAIEAAYDQAATAMFSFLAFMLEDYEEGACGGELFLFDITRATAEQTGQVFDGVFGWDLSMEDEGKETGLVYNAADWFTD